MAVLGWDAEKTEACTADSTFHHMGTENGVTMEKGGVRWSRLSPSSSLYVASHSLRYESMDSLLSKHFELDSWLL